jgi:hypothetical protein
VAFGWQNSHLHTFAAADGRRWLQQESLDEGMDGRDEATATLADVLTEDLCPLHDKYDFGDGWQHTIELIEIIDENQPVPRLIRGERAGPLEDSGGPGGYGELLRVIADPSDPEHERLREWALDQRFTPEPGNGRGTALPAGRRIGDRSPDSAA